MCVSLEVGGGVNCQISIFVNVTLYSMEEKTCLL